ncbi:PREDICTED: uncharacterized protein LOC105564310 [Vollenhovia emeryi]|uniref:uncharacterized protein LOC105564310 n=1 Tax=Vollenhovia emeryi TaxID=411798 RepID=UPI0005F37374|nr:PREDICTED: uncharacterized protein LOC105564310 [Vollenhovia emeryi]
MSATRTLTGKPDVRGVKSAVTTSKYRQDAQIPKGQKEKTEQKITPTIIHITIQAAPDKIRTEKKRSKRKLAPDTGSVACVRDSSTDIPDKDERKPDRREKIRRVIFPEMRGGILYSRCWCLHRDGLQDHCPLSQCQGQPECLVKPWAACPPGKFVRSRHPELYPKASDASYKQYESL